jgi:hypothetical protein
MARVATTRVSVDDALPAIGSSAFIGVISAFIGVSKDFRSGNSINAKI